MFDFFCCDEVSWIMPTMGSDVVSIIIDLYFFVSGSFAFVLGFPTRYLANLSSPSFFQNISLENGSPYSLLNSFGMATRFDMQVPAEGIFRSDSQRANGTDVCNLSIDIFLTVGCFFNLYFVSSTLRNLMCHISNICVGVSFGVPAKTWEV